MDGLAVTDDILRAVAKYCSKMEHLSIVDCGTHTKVGILALAKQAPVLEVIVAGPKDPVLSDLAVELMHEKIPWLQICLPLRVLPLAKPVVEVGLHPAGAALLAGSAVEPDVDDSSDADY